MRVQKPPFGYFNIEYFEYFLCLRLNDKGIFTTSKKGDPNCTNKVKKVYSKKIKLFYIFGDFCFGELFVQDYHYLKRKNYNFKLILKQRLIIAFEKSTEIDKQTDDLV